MVFILVFVLSLIFPMTTAYADAVVVVPPGSLPSCSQDAFPMLQESVQSFLDTMSTHFPFSVFSFSISVLDQLSSLSPQSPTDFEMCFFGPMCVYPLSFLDSGVFDFLFSAFRILLVVLMIFSLGKFLLEYVV